MSTLDYDLFARQYADGVRAFFAPATPDTGERSRGTAASTFIVERAEELAPVSTSLTQVTAAKLGAADPLVRGEAETQLLAKALTDLEISRALLEAARDEEAGATPDLTVIERSGETPGAGAREELLSILAASDPTAGTAETRRSSRTAATRQELIETASDTLLIVRDRASKTGQTALGGLLGLGAGELLQAAGVVGMDIAQALGQAEAVTRLYTLFREFAIKAYESILALLGPAVSQTAAKQVVEWVDALRNGALFGDVLDKLYQTAQTETNVQTMVRQAQVDRARLAIATDRVSRLGDQYGRQTSLAERLLKGLRLLGGVPAAVLPQAQLLLAAAYIVLGGYVILAGADYVDAPGAKLLDRTPGVRQVIATELAAA